jgi:hypothetical protein
MEELNKYFGDYPKECFDELLIELLSKDKSEITDKNTRSKNDMLNEK